MSTEAQERQQEESELIAVEAEDRIVDAAELRYQALATAGNFKALRKEAKDLADDLDEIEEQAATHEEQTLLFDDQAQAMLKDEECSLRILQLAGEAARRIRNSNDLEAATKALRTIESALD